MKMTSEEEENEKRERLRARILQEINDTEETYRNHLKLVIELFRKPLCEKELVPPDIIFLIFSNIQQILDLNQELVNHLQNENVGIAFLRMAPFLKLYATYANNHEKALATLMDWEQKHPEFAVWRREQEARPEVAGLKLNALLITPVQRIPRYKLLLEQLLNQTEACHPDYETIKAAVKEIAVVASHINEHIRQQENFMKIIVLQKSLAGSSVPNLLVPGRQLLKEGILKKVSRRGNRSFERMFFLFSDIFMYAKPKLLGSEWLGGYSCCCIMPLHHCSVSRLFGTDETSKAVFTVECQGESLLLFSEKEVVDSWMVFLVKAISKYKKHRQTLKKSCSAKIPVKRHAVKLKKLLSDASNVKLRLPKDNFQNPSKCSTPQKIKKALVEATMPCVSPKKAQLHSLLEISSPQPCFSQISVGISDKRCSADNDYTLPDLEEEISSPSIQRRRRLSDLFLTSSSRSSKASIKKSSPLLFRRRRQSSFKTLRRKISNAKLFSSSSKESVRPISNINLIDSDDNDKFASVLIGTPESCVEDPMSNSMPVNLSPLVPRVNLSPLFDHKRGEAVSLSPVKQKVEGFVSPLSDQFKSPRKVSVINRMQPYTVGSLDKYRRSSFGIRSGIATNGLTMSHLQEDFSNITPLNSTSPLRPRMGLCALRTSQSTATGTSYNGVTAVEGKDLEMSVVWKDPEESLNSEAGSPFNFSASNVVNVVSSSADLTCQKDDCDEKAEKKIGVASKYVRRNLFLPTLKDISEVSGNILHSPASIGNKACVIQ